MFYRILNTVNVIAKGLHTAANVINLQDALTATQKRNRALIKRLTYLEKAVSQGRMVCTGLAVKVIEAEQKIKELECEVEKADLENEILKCDINIHIQSIDDLRKEHADKLSDAEFEYDCMRDAFLETCDKLRDTNTQFNDYRLTQEIALETCRSRASMYYDLYTDLHSRNPQLSTRF